MDDLIERVDALARYLDVDGRRQKLKDLQARRLEPGFWDDNERARETEQAIAAEKTWTDAFDALDRRRDDILTLGGLNIGLFHSTRPR